MTDIAVDTSTLVTVAARLKAEGREAGDRARGIEAVMHGLDLEIKARAHLDVHLRALSGRLSDHARRLTAEGDFLTYAAARYERAESELVAAAEPVPSEVPEVCKAVASDATQEALETLADLKKKILDGFSVKVAEALGASPGYATEALSDLLDALLGLVSLGAADYVFKAIDVAQLTALLAMGDMDAVIQELLSQARQMVIDLATGKLGIPGIPLGAIAKMIEGYYHLGQALGENNMGAYMVQGFLDGVPILINRPGQVVSDAIDLTQDVAAGVGHVVGETVQEAGDVIRDIFHWG